MRRKIFAKRSRNDEKYDSTAHLPQSNWREEEKFGAKTMLKETKTINEIMLEAETRKGCRNNGLREEFFEITLASQKWKHFLLEMRNCNSQLHAADYTVKFLIVHKIERESECRRELFKSRNGTRRRKSWHWHQQRKGFCAIKDQTVILHNRRKHFTRARGASAIS